MAETIEVIEREAQPVLVVHSTASVFKIAKTLANSFDQVTTQIRVSGTESVGAPFARYSGIDWADVTSKGVLGQIWQMLTEKMNISAGMPVADGAEGKGAVEAIELPAGRYLRTFHVGPYQKVGNTYKKLVAWAAEQNLTMDSWSCESYVDDPTTKPMAEVRTEVFVALKD
ncbi:MAG: GyrI-like domain-containing protein [Pseudomonadota bacterium]